MVVAECWQRIIIWKWITRRTTWTFDRQIPMHSGIWIHVRTFPSKLEIGFADKKKTVPGAFFRLIMHAPDVFPVADFDAHAKCWMELSPMAGAISTAENSQRIRATGRATW
jgi:hypothetical protein